MKPSSRLALVLVAGFAVALASLSCRQIVGIKSDPPQDLNTTACGLPFGTGACASCVAANCCTQSTACADNLVCFTYESCMGPCSGDPACRSQCTIANPVGDWTAVSPLSACVVAQCATECGIPCGGVEAYITEPPQAAACQGCLLGSPSCSDALAWAGSVDGDAYWRCYRSCSTPDCWSACAVTHPQGAALFSTFQTLDYSGTCATECRFGGYWACIGQVSWPTPENLTNGGSAAMSAFTFSLFDTQKDHWAGADVSICTQCPCPSIGNSAWYQGISGDGGVVTGTMTYPLDPEGYGINGCIEVTSSADSGLNLIPTFCYWGYTLSEPTLGSLANQGCAVETIAEAEGVAISGELDPTTRSYVVGATIFDCLGFPAPHVILTMSPPPDSDTSQFYGLDLGNLTRRSTDGTGIGGFINVLPPLNFPDAAPTGLGSVTLTATPQIGDAAAFMPSSVATVAVQAGAATEVVMYPTPISIP